MLEKREMVSMRKKNRNTLTLIKLLADCRSKSQFTADSKLHCPDCDTDVHVGTGGISNLNVHQDSKTCQENNATKTQPLQKKEKSILNFFSQNSVQQNTPQVVSSPPVHTAPVLSDLTSMKALATQKAQLKHPYPMGIGLLLTTNDTLAQSLLSLCRN